MIRKMLSIKNLVIVALLLFLMAIIIKCAWIVDDAYISFRYVKNILNGYGLRWNTFERVQAYTNPLYVFLMIPLYALSKDMFLSSIFLSVAITMSAVIIAFIPKKKNNYIPYIVSIILLVTSKAFIDYSTSGLENPISFLTIALFYKVYFSCENPSEGKTFLKLCFIASIITINRLDAILLFIPALCHGFFKNFKAKKIAYGFLGFSPFIVWEIFSFLYYGFFFPNTAYAKLNIATGKLDLWANGIKYIITSNVYGDNITLLAIVSVIIWGLFLFKKRQSRYVMASASVLFYILYIINIGGDFMAGRFLSAPFFLAVVITYNYLGELHIGKQGIKSLSVKITASVCALVLFLGIIPQTSPITADKQYESFYDYLRHTNPVDRPRDVRSFYYEDTGLLHYLKYAAVNGYEKDRIIHKWGIIGSEYEAGETYISGGIGFLGYFAPSEAIIIDIYALTDPLLARIPSPPDLFAGHYEREIPAGYEQTLKTGVNSIENAALHEYYDKLHLVVSGKIFSTERIKTAFELNFGKYDYLIEEYRDTLDY